MPASASSRRDRLLATGLRYNVSARKANCRNIPITRFDPLTEKVGPILGERYRGFRQPPG